MKQLMTKHFSKWLSKQKVSEKDLSVALSELQAGYFEANLGGYLYKKRIRFEGQGKSGSGRTIICYKKEDRAIFIHGFAKNEKSNLSKKELQVFKELSKILMGFSVAEITIAIENGDFIEVKS
ncbi:MAG: type II toxin-antitoxin system RelE/ParE family toxin [Desulfobacteraceae bacterium]|nr:type II toxin-antitoxin system RelE/ParE family toxin [Desulfobacteraceae bacterium]MBC2718770.1 type II toxin-antitoxin system RelE/ParE family toxin [Desulfobacteraceae bacterium]